MPTLELALTVPEGTTVTITGLPEPAGTEGPAGSQVARYWRDYLSANGRSVFAAAARIQNRFGPGFTLEDIAENLSISYESVRSMHRSTGRTAKRWRKETGIAVPIELEWSEYEWDETREGNRTVYGLPESVAEEIGKLDTEGRIP
jgi:hypothetical protein